jgi:hypothetical protein
MRRALEGLRVSGHHLEYPNTSMSVLLSGTGEIPFCERCAQVVPLTPDECERRDAAFGRFWARRLRWRWGVRVHRDDQLSLGVSWVPCHHGRPLAIYLLGLVIKIGCFQGDERRVTVWSLPSWPAIKDRLTSPHGTPSPDYILRPEVRRYRGEWLPLRRGPCDSRWRVPEYVGLGVSLDCWRWRAKPTWRFTVNLGWWRLWAGVTQRKTAAAQAHESAAYFLPDDED